jgi:hypothetical protein
MRQIMQYAAAEYAAAERFFGGGGRTHLYAHTGYAVKQGGTALVCGILCGGNVCGGRAVGLANMRTQSMQKGASRCVGDK